MKTLAFILFAVVTAAVAALATIASTRYLSLEKELGETQTRLEAVLGERKRQEEEKMTLRLERERAQSEMEGRVAELRNALDACQQKQMQELLEIGATMKILQKAVIDIQVQMGASGRTDPTPDSSGSPDAPKADGAKGESKAPAQPNETRPASSTDVPKGAIPTPEAEARKLDKVQ